MPNIITSSSMPKQEVPPYPSGANSPMTAGIKLQQQQTANQMALIGSKKGGSPQVLVPPVSSGAVNPQQTQDLFAKITSVAETEKVNSSFDNTKTQAQVANVASQQEALYKGGKSKSYYRHNRHGTNGYKFKKIMYRIRSRRLKRIKTRLLRKTRKHRR
jgi:hypothetical protein